jgi:hypothetical protein
MSLDRTDIQGGVFQQNFIASWADMLGKVERVDIWIKILSIIGLNISVAKTKVR